MVSESKNHGLDNTRNILVSSLTPRSWCDIRKASFPLDLSLPNYRMGKVPGYWSSSALIFYKVRKDFPGSSTGKESTSNAGDLGSIPGLGRSPRGGTGNPLQYFCLENPHGQRSLAGYSPWDCKELDTTEQLSTAQQGRKNLRPHGSFWIRSCDSHLNWPYIVFSSKCSLRKSPSPHCESQEETKRLVLLCFFIVVYFFFFNVGFFGCTGSSLPRVDFL